MSKSAETVRGRGSAENPKNRFISLEVIRDEPLMEDERIAPATQFFKDSSRSIIAYNDSPDVGFEYSLNPYRGCEHGCIYCYARPTHEYLGFSAGIEFESKIMVKTDAPQLLRAELSKRSWKAKMVAIGGVTDPYQPVERRLKVTRQCLEVFSEFGNPVGIVTKNHLVTRDIDVLSEMAKRRLAAVFVSVTTLDAELTRIMEPRTSVPQRRLAAIEKLSSAGVPVGVMVAPVVPGLTDHEMPGIMKAAREAGAMTAGYVPVRLPFAVKELFEAWLERHMPDRKDKVLNRIRSVRDGKLNDSNFHTRMKGQGVFAEQMKAMFDLAYRKEGFGGMPELTTYAFRRPTAQLDLFQSQLHSDSQQ